MKKLSVAFVDVLGLVYDGRTLETRGLGGSESAIIYMSRELAALGFDVTVYNNCQDSQASPGVYDGVTYRDLTSLNGSLLVPPVDIFIGSRSVKPFVESKFEILIGPKTHKVLWMHDTFCDGDHLVESLTLSGKIDEIFTLSDFHTTYVSFCFHGHRRNPEVLKSKMFMTRNGIKRHIEEVDILAKDPNLFVYNASVTKGMIPLVQKIWPRVKSIIPSAKLKVIGGYYRFRDNANPDKQEEDWRAMANDPVHKNRDVEFTGIIPQQEIAQILAKASFMLYPGAFPETYGISTLESLAYNTPLITTRFGALEETAITLASYFINYAIEPNVLYPDINQDNQIEQFVQLTNFAYNTPYLAAQKRQYCHIIRDICGWDGVALQWKQHFFSKLGQYLPVDEYCKVQHLNQRIHTVFGRRFSNPEEWATIPVFPQEPIAVISPFYNGEAYIEDCIRSVAAQDYDNYTHVLIDDASTDDGYLVAKAVIESLPPNIRQRFHLVKNTENVGSVANYVTEMQNPIGTTASDPIIMMLDGDDSLMPRNDIFQFYNRLYAEGAEFTYGSCWSMVDDIPLVGQPYPKAVRDARTYRSHRFAWNMPYTHLRTFRQHLIRGLPTHLFKDDKGEWFRAGGDVSIFYNTIERANPNKVVAVQDIVCRYNDINPINDYKVNSREQTAAADYILNQQSASKTTLFTVVVPTMWKHPPFLDFLVKLEECPWVDEILIINNDPSLTPKLFDFNKARMLTKGLNIFVNPAWNWGVAEARNDRICILNDDVEFDLNLFQKMDAIYGEGFGCAGLCPGVEFWGQPPITDGSIDIIPWTGQGIHGFGCLMFVDKRNWVPIANGMNLYWGDNFIFDNHLKMGLTNYLITNMKFVTPFATTVTKIGPIDGILEKEKAIYDTLKLPIFP